MYIFINPLSVCLPSLTDFPWVFTPNDLCQIYSERTLNVFRITPPYLTSLVRSIDGLFSAFFPVGRPFGTSRPSTLACGLRKRPGSFLYNRESLSRLPITDKQIWHKQHTALLVVKNQLWPAYTALTILLLQLNSLPIVLIYVYQHDTYYPVYYLLWWQNISSGPYKTNIITRLTMRKDHFSESPH